MMTFNNGGILDKAEYAVWRSNIRTMQESFQMNTQNMMLENIGFNGNQINVHEKDANFKEELEKAIPILSTLKNQNIKERSYSEIVQIYDGKLYWSDTIENSNKAEDIEIQQILTEMGIVAYNGKMDDSNDPEEIFEKIYITSEYKLENTIGDTCIIGFNIDEEKKAFEKITLPNIYIGNDGNEYKIQYIRHDFNLGHFADDIVAQFPYLKKVIVPNGYTSIGYYGFWYCENLEEIILPNTLTTISEGAFYHCTSLKKINLPNKLSRIDKSAFRECYELGILDNGVITIPEGVTTIEDGAFYDCTSLRTVNLPNTIYSIGKNVFYGCNSSLVINVNKKESECSDTMKSNLSSMGFTVNYKAE